MSDEQILDKLSMEGLTLTTSTKRALAYTIDEIIISVLVFIIFYNQLSTIANENDLVNISNTLFKYVVALKVIYHTFFIWQYGATMGKIFLKIRVVDVDTLDNLNLYKSFSRAMMRVISEAIFYLGYLWGILNITKQTWHDKFANSLVLDV